LVDVEPQFLDAPIGAACETRTVVRCDLAASCVFLLNTNVRSNDE
jgi:hypothetical protein